VPAVRAEAADKDLREIAYQIGIVSGRPATADKIIDEMIDCCDQLANRAKFSRRGTAAPKLGQGVRLLPFRRWVIIFRYIDDGVTVLRIADGSQDYLSWKL
jgi:plasmid stabilization system protein ParE